MEQRKMRSETEVRLVVEQRGHFASRKAVRKAQRMDLLISQLNGKVLNKYNSLGEMASVLSLRWRGSLMAVAHAQAIT